MKVIVGIGIPGSGKTTYLKPLAAELGLAYINADDIRQELTGDATNHTQEKRVWGLFHARLRRAIKESGAVVDATYSRPSDRRRLVRLIREEGKVQIIAYWFTVPLELCKARNALRERVVPESVLEQMHERLIKQPPTTDEGFNEIIKVDY